ARDRPEHEEAEEGNRPGEEEPPGAHAAQPFGAAAYRPVAADSRLRVVFAARLRVVVVCLRVVFAAGGSLLTRNAPRHRVGMVVPGSGQPRVAGHAIGSSSSPRELVS